jgi:ribosomal protein S18 acetylase RimI-like enzyme
MMSASEWVVEPLSTSRNIRDSFECGNEALDSYIRHYAGQDFKRRISLVVVARLPRERVIRGYYTLSAASFHKQDLPAPLARKLPHYPVPAALLGLLAVDRSCQGLGLGEHLLMDCLERVLQASKLIAVYAVIADAKDERAKAFYEKYGFQAFLDQPLRLFLPVATIAQVRTGESE